MRGRMIHDRHGNLQSQLYDKDAQVCSVVPVYYHDSLFSVCSFPPQCINSIDRALLNEELLDEASAVPNVRLNFKHKVLSADFDQNLLVIRDVDSGSDARVNFDLCIGADGSYSVIRRQLMRVVRFVDISLMIFTHADVLPRRMNFQQEYIPHEYIELKMPAGHDEHGNPAFLLDPNHLHIWPRHSFMLIALPNKVITHSAFYVLPT